MIAYVSIPHYPNVTRAPFVHVPPSPDHTGSHRGVQEQPLDPNWGMMAGIVLCVVLIVACIIAYDIRRTGS